MNVTTSWCVFHSGGLTLPYGKLGGFVEILYKTVKKYENFPSETPCKMGIGVL